MTTITDEARKAAWDGYMGYVQLVDEGEALPATEYAVDAALTAALPHIKAAIRAEALREARGVITQYLSTAEKWRYERVVIAFGVMLGELPEDTPMPEAVAPWVTEAAVREQVAQEIEAELGTTIFHPHYRYGMECAAAIVRGADR